MKVFVSKISILSLLLWCFILAAATAQTPLTHEHKVYQSEDKKTYWNKNAPVYIKLSSSPDENAESFLLKSDTSAKYTEPYFFDTEGTNFIRTRWAVNKATKKTVEPKIEVLWEVHSDGLAPVSKIKLNSEILAMTNGKRYYGQNAEALISSKDKVSGLDKIFYSINGENYTEYSAALNMTEEKQYTIKYYAVDKVGNAETPNTETFYLDLSAPVTSHQIIGEVNENVLSNRTKLSLKANDEFAGIGKTLYSFDDGKEKLYTAPLDISLLPEGEHKIKFRSVDKVKNEEAIQEYAFFIDKSAPIVKMEIIGDQFSSKNGKEYISGRAQVSLNAEDNKAGVKSIFYSINGGAAKPYDSPFTLASKGNNKIEFYAVDKVGNKSALQNNKNHKSAISYVDLDGPNLSHNYLGATFRTRDTIFIGPNTKIQLKGEDSEAGMNKILYSMNDEESIEYGKPFVLEKEGFYKLRYTGFDNVINSNEETITVVVDNSGPEIFPTFDGTAITKKNVDGASLEVYPSHVSLFLSVTDSKLGYDKIFYSINGAPETLYTNPLQGFNKGKDYKIKIRALDKLGNTSIEDVAFGIAD